MTQFSLNRQKNGQIKGRIRARSPILNPTIQQLIVHVYNILALKIHEKTPTQIFNVHMLYRERKKNG